MFLTERKINFLFKMIVSNMLFLRLLCLIAAFVEDAPHFRNTNIKIHHRPLVSVKAHPFILMDTP